MIACAAPANIMSNAAEMASVETDFFIRSSHAVIGYSFSE
jgi:hypothetical protein